VVVTGPLEDEVMVVFPLAPLVLVMVVLPILCLEVVLTLPDLPIRIVTFVLLMPLAIS
jgi:hypothetical protein